MSAASHAAAVTDARTCAVLVALVAQRIAKHKIHLCSSGKEVTTETNPNHKQDHTDTKTIKSWLA